MQGICTVILYTGIPCERLCLTFDPNSPPVLSGIPVLFIPGNAGSHKQGVQDRYGGSAAVYFLTHLSFSSICSPSSLSLAPSTFPLLLHKHKHTSFLIHTHTNTHPSILIHTHTNTLQTHVPSSILSFHCTVDASCRISSTQTL